MLHDDCAQAERLVSGRLAWPDRAAEAALRRGQLASTARCFRADSIVTAVWLIWEMLRCVSDQFSCVRATLWNLHSASD